MESVNAIINGVASKLLESFGEGYQIYVDEKEQGFKEPCFFILCKNPTRERFLGKRFRYKNQIEVKYFGVTEDKNADFNEVREKLHAILEIIEVEGEKMMGTKMEGTCEKGVLNFVVNYDFFVYEKSEEELMGSYRIETKGKE